MSTNENAPSMSGNTLVSVASSSPPPSAPSGENARESSSATRSLSLATTPGSIPARSASAAVLVRLPL